MNLIKAILLSILGLILFTFNVLTDCRENDTQLQKALNDFSQIIEQDRVDELHLKIYYLHPFVLTRAPLTVDKLIHGDLSQEIIIEGEDLKKYTDLLAQINADDFVHVKHTSRLDARLCYIFETDNDGIILEVAVGGDNNSIFVNGIEVEYNDLFYDVIKPFLTEEATNDIECIFSGKIFYPSAE